MKNKNHLQKLTLIIVMLLSGCMANTYPLTNHIPQAQLGFAQDKTFNNANSGLVFSDYKTCHFFSPIPDYPAITTINADQFTTILITHFIGTKQLQLAATFYAKANHTYLIHTKKTGRKHNTSTTMIILDQTGNNLPTSLTLMAPREYKMAYGELSACLNNDMDFYTTAKFYSLQQNIKHF